MARCKSTYPGSVTLRGRAIRCESAAGHSGQHGHSFAARYWDDASTDFAALPIGSAFSFVPGRYVSADPDGYVKRSPRGWTHPTYGNGTVGSIRVRVIGRAS
jgi:hypothetical protein